jgi:hypothetical protein
MVKRKIDVEKFLQWSYRDELPKQSVGGLTGWERLVLLGTQVDESERDYSLPVALGPPHPDALQLDYAVRHLPHSVGVDWARSRDHLMGDLACWIDARDPRTAHMSTSAMALVMAHARMGTRPHWDLGAVRLLRVHGKNGKPVVEGITPGRRYSDGAHCPLRLDPEAHDIACARFEYWVWREALAQLVRESWNYTEHILQMPSAAAAPWLNDDERRSRVLRASGDDEELSKLPINPSRPITLPPLAAPGEQRRPARSRRILTTTE